MPTIIRPSVNWPALVLSLLLSTFCGTHAQSAFPAPPSSAAQTNAEVLASYKKMSLEELMDQQVTSVSKQPETYAKAPAAIQVVTGEDIRRSGATSIPEALRLADNLDVAQVSSSTWAISARGFNSSVGDKLLVLMDGRSVYTPLYSGVIWNMQDYLLADIDRIEAVSGPGGTLWGANAVNGVINITSKNAKDTQGYYMEAGGGSTLEDSTGVRYGGRLATNVYFRVYGKYFDQNSEVFADGHDAHDSWNKGQGGFRIDTDNPSQDQFTLQGDIYGGDLGTMPAGEGTARAEGNIGGANLLGRWTHTYADDADMSLQVYYDRSHLGAPFQGAPAVGAIPIGSGTFPASPAIPSGTLYDDLDTADIDFQDRFPLGTRNNVIWGLGYRFTHDDVQNVPSVAFLPDTLDRDLYSGFLQDEIKLQDDLFLTLGSKVEHNDYTGFEYEPNVRLQWNVTDRQMVWAAVSRAIRMPSRYDTGLFLPNPAYLYIYHLEGNPSFESETVLAYELGYRAQLTSRVSGSVSAFFNDYDHLRSESESIDPSNPTSLVNVYYANNLKGQTYGFELSSDYEVSDWWRLHAGYDFLEEAIYPAAADVNAGLAQTADPENQVFLRSSMDLPGNLELDPAFRWIDTVHNNNNTTVGTVSAYAEVDVRLAWHATKNLELSIVGQNLVQDRHAESGYPGPQQEEIARSVFAKIAWRF